jgi:peptide chain release factor 2
VLPNSGTTRKRLRTRVGEVAALKNKINPVNELSSRIADFSVLIEIAQEEGDDSSMDEVRSEVEAIQKELDRIELLTLLNGPHDSENAFLTIHAGAGGTEACDWADMLVRMYQRWGQQQGFKTEMVDLQPGEEAWDSRSNAPVRGRECLLAI